MLTKEFKEFSPRILDHILITWAERLSKMPGWTKNDSKICLMLQNKKKDFYKEQYKNRRINQLNNQNEQKIIRKRRGS